MSTKANAFPILKSFLTYVERQFERKIKIVRSDNAYELGFGTLPTEFFSSQGIIHQTSCVATPQQNGVAKRKHRHLLEICRALMYQSHLQPRYWEEALLTATHIINILPSKVLNHLTPYEKLFHKPPSYTHLKLVV